MVNHTLTITGTTGPDQDVTTLLFEYVTDLNFDLVRGVLTVFYNKNGTILNQAFDYTLVTTVTWTITSGMTAVVVS